MSYHIRKSYRTIDKNSESYLKEVTLEIATDIILCDQFYDELMDLVNKYDSIKLIEPGALNHA